MQHLTGIAIKQTKQQFKWQRMFSDSFYFYWYPLVLYYWQQWLFMVNSYGGMKGQQDFSFGIASILGWLRGFNSSCFFFWFFFSKFSSVKWREIEYIYIYLAKSGCFFISVIPKEIICCSDPLFHQSVAEGCLKLCSVNQNGLWPGLICRHFTLRCSSWNAAVCIPPVSDWYFVQVVVNSSEWVTWELY